MAKLRIRLRLNEGGEGAPLDQLVAVSKETERFLRCLAQDVGMAVPKGQWLARNFENGSVSFDSEHAGEWSIAQVKEFNAGFRYVASFEPGRQRFDGGIRHGTLLQYVKITDGLASHEKVGFGLYAPNGNTPDQWHPLTKRQALTLRDQLTEEVTYVGTIQGNIHNFVAELPFRFSLRLSRSGDLVRCDIGEPLYDDLVKTLTRRNALVYVQGRIRARRIDRSIQAVDVFRLKSAPPLSDQAYQSFFGASPNYTGDMSTEQFIEEARSYDR